ncbi:hypothetical protein [Hydrogenophaga atypica]|uniref:Uncharacterized protein n=1 Tax=Hydrogenophaga atypica TaxID=249409 RepID=A0ABW2QLH3_9BURK
MKKGQSLADQLSDLRSGVQTVVKRQVVEPTAQKKLCTEIVSGRPLITFLTEAEAVVERESMWSTASASTSVVHCKRCSFFHLLDSQGLPLVEKKSKVVGPNEDRDLHTASRRVRSRCPNCRSSQTRDMKVIFESVADAQAAIDDLRVEIPYILDAYHCPFGNGIHLTKQSPRRPGEHIAALFQSKYIEKKRLASSVPGPAQEAASFPRLKKEGGAPSRMAKNFRCVLCGYAKNYEMNLKCAWCGELGSYEDVD